MPKKDKLHILLADDDMDDRYFFERALKEIHFDTSLTTVSNGEQLMQYLNNCATLPDVLFLDLNMPRKNGFECLEEIKSDKKTGAVTVIIYSTTLISSVADQLYQDGAHYCIQKDTSDLTKLLEYVFTLLENSAFQRPAREEFIIDSTQTQDSF